MCDLCNDAEFEVAVGYVSAEVYVVIVCLCVAASVYVGLAADDSDV